MQLVSVPGVFRVLSADVVLRLAARQQQGASSNGGDGYEFHAVSVACLDQIGILQSSERPHTACIACLQLLEAFPRGHAPLRQGLHSSGLAIRWVLTAHQMALAQRLHQLEVPTKGPGFTRLNETLNRWIAGTGITQGVLHLTCLHTSASLTINENADPRVLKDLQAWMDALVPQDGKGPINGDGKRTRYLHDDEGDDDMPAHIRTALTSQTMTLSIDNRRLLLGVWQGVYLWEHRAIPHVRRIACHVVGDLQETPTEEFKPGTGANTASMLRRRSGAKLNEAVQARFDPDAWERDDIDTDVDLLVDRLHEIAEDPRKRM